MSRYAQLQAWLKTVLPSADFLLTPASEDASFRRYFRVHLASGATFIVMDAPPAQESCVPFMHVAQHLARAQVRVPELLAHHVELGFILLTDFGDTTYLLALNETNADRLYQAAIVTLIRIQQLPHIDLPLYDHTLLHREMHLFPQWYMRRHLNKPPTEPQTQLLTQLFSLLAKHMLAQTQVVVHRDYHARNLMLIADTEANAVNPGVLDFQDAVIGAMSYDLVSLLKDAYIEWSEERVLDWTVRYWQAAKSAGLAVPHDFAVFYRDFEWAGVQRQLKILGIFARLCYRDGKDSYISNMPLVRRYLLNTSARYAELHGLHLLLQECG